MLDQQRGHRGAWRQRAAKLSEHVTWDPGRAGRERALGRSSSRGGIEPEIEQRRDQAGGAVAADVEDDEFAGLSIAQAGLSTGQEAGTNLIYVLLAGATIIGPLLVHLAMGLRATETLGGWGTWLADNNAAVMSVLRPVFAVVLIGKVISGLSG